MEILIKKVAHFRVCFFLINIVELVRYLCIQGEYMRALFDDIVRAIKQHLPDARISWDISPWIGEAGKSRFPQ